MDTSRGIPYLGPMYLRSVAAFLFAVIALAAGACGEETPPPPPGPRMDFQVTRGSCACTQVTGYVILLLGTEPLTHLPCLHYSQSAQPGPEAVLQGLGFTDGQSLDVAILAYCGNPSCVACATKTKRIEVADEGSVGLELTSSTIPCVGLDPLLSPSMGRCP